VRDRVPQVWNRQRSAFVRWQVKCGRFFNTHMRWSSGTWDLERIRWPETLRLARDPGWGRAVAAASRTPPCLHKAVPRSPWQRRPLRASQPARGLRKGTNSFWGAARSESCLCKLSSLSTSSPQLSCTPPPGILGYLPQPPSAPPSLHSFFFCLITCDEELWSLQCVRGTGVLSGLCKIKPCWEKQNFCCYFLLILGYLQQCVFKWCHLKKRSKMANTIGRNVLLWSCSRSEGDVSVGQVVFLRARPRAGKAGFP